MLFAGYAILLVMMHDCLGIPQLVFHKSFWPSIPSLVLEMFVQVLSLFLCLEPAQPLKVCFDQECQRGRLLVQELLAIPL